MSTKSRYTSIQEKGFTLVELMVALVISGVVMAGVYSAYTTQQRSYTTQETVAQMQQNIRAAKILPSRDIRMAGYSAENSTSHSTCNLGAAGTAVSPGILATTANRLELSFDSNADGDCADPGENISYYLYTAGGIQMLGRLDNNSPPVQALAEEIENIEFRYLDNTGTPTAIPADVRAVQISILARTGRPDRKFVNSTVYCPASNPFNPITDLCTAPAPSWGAYNDNLRRRLLITTTQCRNMGL